MAGEQGWIKSSQLTVAARRKIVTCPNKIDKSAGTGADFPLGFVAERDLYITKIQGITVETCATAAPAIQIGNAITANAYGTCSPTSTQAAGTSVSGTPTLTLVPAGTVVTADWTVAANAGEWFMQFEVEYVEQDLVS